MGEGLMADYIITQRQGAPAAMRTKYRDMADTTHALVVASYETAYTLQSDDISGALNTIDIVHNEIHEGEFFSVSFKSADDSAIADNATIAFALTPATKYVHLQAVGAMGGDAEIEFYEVSTVTGGTATTPRNHNRNGSDNSDVTVVRDPTVNTAGTLLENIFLPGGTGPQAVGGAGGQRQEWVLRPAITHVVRITNRAGTAQPGSLSVSWYEESTNG
jgi:hypothetical protein